MVQNVRRLDSEMQQLVYENYNKFLTATATVRNMQTAFAEMDKEVQGLSERMQSIAQLSDSLSEMFSNNRAAVRKLTENSKTIKRLQYFVKLPQILQESISQRNYKKAVKIYINVRPKLEKYKDTKSMSGIYSDCKNQMEALEKQFRETLVTKTFIADDVLEAAQLLRRFGIIESEICTQLLAHWYKQLTAELDALELQVNGLTPSMTTEQDSSDVLDFVDCGCCTFLTNLSLYISVFVQLFKRPEDKADLMELVEKSMQSLESLLLRRFAAEKNSRDCALFVKALDRISRKIAVFSRVLPGMDFSRMNAAVVVGAAEHEIKLCREGIQQSIRNNFKELLDAYAKESLEVLPATLEKLDEQPSNSKVGENLRDIVAKIEQAFLVSVKTGLANLLLFTANDMNFSNIDPVYFGSAGTFSMNVYENVVVGSLSDLSDLAQRVRDVFGEISSDMSADFFLLFCAFLQALQTKHVSYIIDLSQEQFKLMELKGTKKGIRLTSLDALTKQLKLAMSNLLRDFVEAQCKSLDAVIVKSFEQFDWSQISESPRFVRTLAKHLLHCLEAINQKICQLTGEKMEACNIPSDSTPVSSIRRAASAASSTLTSNYETTSLGGFSMDAGGAMGIMEKLWSDEPEDQQLNLSLDRNDTNTAPLTLASIVTAVASSLEFRRKQIIGAIMRVCLRRVAECLMRCTFSTCGLQQLQLDCAYLKHHLLDFVADEHMLNTLIDECVTVGVSQCAEPRLLEPIVVRSVCERR